jgi:flagellar basal-body rod modification protein FlgD
MTMDISALTSMLPADRTGSSAQSSLSREDFMNILLAEMSHQDPLNPVDNQEFLSQLAQLQTLEATSALSDGIASLVALGRLSAAGQLVGMTVRGAGTDGEEIAGTVEKILVRGTQVSVSVNGAEVPLERITEMGRGDAPV